MDGRGDNIQLTISSNSSLSEQSNSAVLKLQSADSVHSDDHDGAYQEGGAVGSQWVGATDHFQSNNKDDNIVVCTENSVIGDHDVSLNDNILMGDQDTRMSSFSNHKQHI